MNNPVILFIPVSSSEGVGEYTRSVILAEVLQEQIPDADIHFILNKHTDYSYTCPFNVHYSHHSATKDTPKVKSVLNEIRPDLVIFDCAGRSQQFVYAKSLGAKIIFISQHRKKRARGLKIRRLLNSDLHWVVQPHYAIAQLSYLERLKLKILQKPHPKNIGPILSKIDQGETAELLKKYTITSGEYFIFSAGSGGHKHNNLLAADIFHQAAEEFQRKTNISSIMVFGENYPKKLPVDSSVLCMKHIPNSEFLILLNEAKGIVCSAGDTMLQAIELRKPSVAAIVSKDQPIRLDACLRKGLVLSAKTNAQDLSFQAIKLLNEKKYSSIKENIKNTQSVLGMDIAISDIKKLLKFDCQVINGNSHNYIFYVTLSYSFPVLRPIERELKKRGHNVAWFVQTGSEAEVFLKPDDHRLFTIESIYKYKVHATLAPGNDIPSFFPGIKVQVFHGFDSGKKNKYKIRGYFDLYCTQGPKTTQGFMKERNKMKAPWFNVQETGWSKLDPLFTQHPLTKGFKRERPVILYAPTFSPKLRSTYALYQEIKELSKNENWQWFVKFHPKATRKEIDMYESIENDNLKVIQTDVTIPLLQAADVILSDTSSILSEFALLGKAVVTHNNRLPEDWMINFFDPCELKEKIESALTPSVDLLQKIEQHCCYVHPYQDGLSSVRVVDTIEKLIVSGLKNLAPKPRNYFREWKLKRKLRKLKYEI